MKTKLNRGYKHPIIITLLVIALLFALMPPMVARAAVFKEPAQVKAVKLQLISNSGVRLSWAQVKDAKGYQVYMASSKYGRYEHVKSITSKKVTTYIKTGLKSNRQYRFKVRAYKQYGKKQVYGDFSAIKIATMRK